MGEAAWTGPGDPGETWADRGRRRGRGAQIARFRPGARVGAGPGASGALTLGPPSPSPQRAGSQRRWRLASDPARPCQPRPGESPSRGPHRAVSSYPASSCPPSAGKLHPQPLKLRCELVRGDPLSGVQRAAGISSAASLGHPKFPAPAHLASLAPGIETVECRVVRMCHMTTTPAEKMSGLGYVGARRP